MYYLSCLVKRLNTTMALFGAYFGLSFCCFNIQILKGPCDDNKLKYLFMYCLVFALVIRHLNKLNFHHPPEYE